jgi:hypothetical protein
MRFKGFKIAPIGKMKTIILKVFVALFIFGFGFGSCKVYESPKRMISMEARQGFDSNGNILIDTLWIRKNLDTTLRIHKFYDADGNWLKTDSSVSITRRVFRYGKRAPNDSLFIINKQP